MFIASLKGETVSLYFLPLSLFYSRTKVIISHGSRVSKTRESHHRKGTAEIQILGRSYGTHDKSYNTCSEMTVVNSEQKAGRVRLSLDCQLLVHL